MDFEFYRNFITVAETGNLTTASKKLALAQPALSAQIKTLEHYYGAKLIQTARGKRQLTLTEAGEAFLGKARQICRTEETILLDMQSFNKKASGTLRFSVSPAKSTFFHQHLSASLCGRLSRNLLPVPGRSRQRPDQTYCGKQQ